MDGPAPTLGGLPNRSSISLRTTPQSAVIAARVFLSSLLKPAGTCPGSEITFLGVSLPLSGFVAGLPLASSGASERPLGFAGFAAGLPFWESPPLGLPTTPTPGYQYSNCPPPMAR